MNYFDTSALIRAARLQQQPEGSTRPHALAEFFGIMTGRGIIVPLGGQNVKMALSPASALASARRVFSKMKFTELSAAEVFSALERGVERNIAGKSIHDFLHAAAAEKSGSKSIVTTNEKDFRRMTALKLVPPLQNNFPRSSAPLARL
jgi:predicted nucleic acid-binding protein